jgi:hypothetical protein
MQIWLVLDRDGEKRPVRILPTLAYTSDVSLLRPSGYASRPMIRSGISQYGSTFSQVFSCPRNCVKPERKSASSYVQGSSLAEP